MQWNPLKEEAQLEQIKEKSALKPQVIFLHSTRCSISNMVLNRLETAGQLPDADYYYLDLLAFRNVSDKVEAVFGVVHESPQIIVIKNGKASYAEDHTAITVDALEENI